MNFVSFLFFPFFFAQNAAALKLSAIFKATMFYLYVSFFLLLCFTQNAASSELSDVMVPREEYLETKRKLDAAESRIQQLLNMNKNLNQEVHMLQSMVSFILTH